MSPARPPDGLTAREQLVAIHEMMTDLVKQMMECWCGVVWPALDQAGIKILNHDEIKKRQQRKLREYFESEIFPVLTPLLFDPGHPFPHISNLSLNLAVVVKDPSTGSTHFARVKVPSILPRLVPLDPLDPDELLTTGRPEIRLARTSYRRQSGSAFSRHGDRSRLSLPNYAQHRF